MDQVSISVGIKYSFYHLALTKTHMIVCLFRWRGRGIRKVRVSIVYHHMSQSDQYEVATHHCMSIGSSLQLYTNSISLIFAKRATFQGVVVARLEAVVFCQAMDWVMQEVLRKYMSSSIYLCIYVLLCDSSHSERQRLHYKFIGHQRELAEEEPLRWEEMQLLDL